MSPNSNKRTIILFIGIVVAILIVLTTSTYAEANLVDTFNLKSPLFDFNDLTNLDRLITKIKLL